MNPHAGRWLRSTVVMLAILLAGCATPLDTATRPPPRVDLPEPGGVPRTARPQASGQAARRPPVARPDDGAVAYPGTGGVTSYPASGMPPLGSEIPAPQDDGVTIEYPDAVPGPGIAADGVAYGDAGAPPASGNRAVNVLLAQADTARRDGDLDAAIVAAERALRIAPSDPAAYCGLAELRLARGERAAAEQLARKGLSYRPDPQLRARLEAVLERSHP